ncbi:cytochrome P450 [Amycolatopsis magusensis]|uniref:cytochrome P450 n=1 Tax=Amycolatopsis magusensis TaxID=882444 RepID=UPI0037A60F3C
MPLIELDPLGGDHHGDAARLREAGPVVRAGLPGQVEAAAVTRYRDLVTLVRHPGISKNYRNWSAFQRGDVGPRWPLWGMVGVDNAVTADGDEHRRLRDPIVKALTRRQVTLMQPQIEAAITSLLDDIADTANSGDGVVDLRADFAYPLPMATICDLIGVPHARRGELREAVAELFRTDRTAEQAANTQQRRHQLLASIITEHRDNAPDDMTSKLLQLQDSGDAALSDIELTDTLWLMVTAGHETTLGLTTNASRALLTHPDQLLLARNDDRWDLVVEETLRWDPPITNFLARYPLHDITIAGVRIPAGTAVIAPYASAGRDPEAYGDTAEQFLIHRTGPTTLSFGSGPHMCPGTALARSQATLALKALFTRFPHLELAVPITDIPPVPSLFSNAPSTLPVRLGPATPGTPPAPVPH